MKFGRMKKLFLAVSGFAAYQVAGCNVLDQLQQWFPNLPGLGG